MFLMHRNRKIQPRRPLRRKFPVRRNPLFRLPHLKNRPHLLKNRPRRHPSLQERAASASALRPAGVRLGQGLIWPV
jgi:hypothetical protein